MEKVKWIRQCPSCNVEILYSNKYNLQNAELAKKKCKSCMQKGIRKNFKPGKLSVFQKEFWMRKGMTESESIDKVAQIQSKASSKKTFEKRSEIAMRTSPYRKETWIAKGMTEAEAEFEIKSRKKLNTEYWTKRGFSEEEAIVKVSEFQTLIAKNSKPDGCLPTQLAYWLKKTDGDEEEAKRLLADRQNTFSLEKCISKYGADIGYEKWKERQDKWKLVVFSDVQWIGGGKSKVSSELFRLLLEDESLHGKNERFIREGKTVFKYDFCIKQTKKIIEFNGDFWHCNPSMYSRDYYHPIKKMTSSEIWEYDSQKEKLARSKGYDYLVVWESEYKLFPEETINRCKQFLCSR